MNLADLFSKVHSFMATMKQETPKEAKMPKRKVVLLRFKMALSELKETRDATSLVEAFDGVLDTFYVNSGTAIAYGFTADQVARGLAEVHRSNMSKLWRADELHRVGPLASIEHAANDEQGPLFVVKDKDGKVMKSPTYFPPDLSFIRNGLIVDAE